MILAVVITSCAGGDEDVAAPQTTGAPTEAATTVTATTEAATTEIEASEPVDPADQVESADAETTGEPGAPATVVDAIAAGGSFGTLAGLLEASTLDGTLAGEGPFTVFAPTDDAFAALPEEVLAALEADPTALKQVLTYHVVPESISPDALAPGELVTLEGQRVEITRDATARVNDAQLLAPPLEAGSGWAYPIDLVLLPPDLGLAGLVGEAAAAAAYDRAGYVVFFESGSSDLDASGQQTIDEAAGEVASLPAGSTVRLVGVADPTGDAAANLELSRERAGSVQAALEEALPNADVAYEIRANGEEEGPELANARRVDIILP